jgi:hypothetical protein
LVPLAYFIRERTERSADADKSVGPQRIPRPLPQAATANVDLRKERTFAICGVGEQIGDHAQKLTKVHVWTDGDGPQPELRVQINVARRYNRDSKTVCTSPSLLPSLHLFPRLWSLSFFWLSAWPRRPPIALPVRQQIAERRVEKGVANFGDRGVCLTENDLLPTESKRSLCITIRLLSTTGVVHAEETFDTEMGEGVKMLHVFRKRNPPSKDGNKVATSCVMQYDEHDPILSLMLRRGHRSPTACCTRHRPCCSPPTPPPPVCRPAAPN